MDTALTIKEAAISAAHSTSEATAELLHFVGEGAHSTSFAFADEVAGRLAEALVYALVIEQGGDATDLLNDEERAKVASLVAALHPFIDSRAS